MNESLDASELSSATMRANAAPSTTLSESEFLKQQADISRQAMSRTLKLIGKNLAHGVDPRSWVEAHPWLTVSGAAVAGFAAVAAIPRKTTPAVEPSSEPSSPETEKTQQQPEKSPLWMGIASGLFKTGWKWVIGALVHNVASKFTSDDMQEDPLPADETTAQKPAAAGTI